ncbi:MAG: hypothetical protein ACFCUV_16560 [Rivularia sp. (in: cyanobacteria)]
MAAFSYCMKTSTNQKLLMHQSRFEIHRIITIATVTGVGVAFAQKTGLRDIT